MLLATTLLFVFLLAGYSFALGYEVGNRMKIEGKTPLNIIKPRFRVIYRNPGKQGEINDHYQ